MSQEKKNVKKEKNKRSLPRFIWGILPWVFLLCLVEAIVLNQLKINIEKQRIEDSKWSMMGKKKPDINVITLEMTPAVIRDRIDLPGIVEPWVKLNVLSEVSGKVARKALEEGDRVKKGSVIAVLDSRDYQNTYNSAKASHDAALASLNRLKKLHKGQLSTRSQLDDAIAQVENYKAVMDTAALNLERCSIKAPIAGVINNVFFDQGQYLNKSDQVAQILQMDKVKVKVGIPESDVDAVRKLTDFKVKIDALDGKVFPAKLHFLSKTADSTARLYNLDLALSNPGGEILPDMFTRVEIVKKEVKESMAIPLYSVISRNSQSVVFVVEENKARSRKVNIGLQEGWRVEVTEGLSPGEEVIVVGHRGVNDGQKVNVVRKVFNPEDIVL